MQQKRNFVRLKTRQEARVRFSNEQRVPCEICDFSPQGFFLRGHDHAEYELLAYAQSGASVLLEFAGGPKSQTYAIEGRVAHASETGLGTYVQSMPDAAFQSLLEYRANLYKGAAEVPQDDLDPIDAQTIRGQCLSLFRPFLVRVIGDFFALASERAAEDYRPGSSLFDQSPLSRGLVLFSMARSLAAPRTRPEIRLQSDPTATTFALTYRRSPDTAG